MNDTIFIESCRDRHKYGNACLITWGPQQWYAPVDDVRQTAEDLFTCAAYADLIGELIRADLPGKIISGLTTAMLKDRKPRFFGTPRTIHVMPCGSSVQRVGAVALSKENAFHRGKAEGALTPDEARAMGRAWFQAAEASEADTLFSSTLERAGWLTPAEMDATFELLKDIRVARGDQ